MVLRPSIPLQKFFLLQAVHMILKCPLNNFFLDDPIFCPDSPVACNADWIKSPKETKSYPFSVSDAASASLKNFEGHLAVWSVLQAVMEKYTFADLQGV